MKLVIREYCFIFKRKKSWCGSVNLLDGVIEETHSYHQAKINSFHHSMYFSETQLDKMGEGECAFFFIDSESGNIYINPMCREHIEYDEDFIINRIKEQIQIIFH